MKTIMTSILFLITAASPLSADTFQSRDFSPAERAPLIDNKNVMGTIGNLVLIRTFENGVSNLNNAISYIEAYDIYTGQRHWTHRNLGMIVSFIIVNPETLVLRTYGKITAIDLYSGRTLWQRETLGNCSVVLGE